MFGQYKKLKQDNERLWEMIKANRAYDEKRIQNSKRIKESEVVFESIAGIKNMYVDDKLEFGYEIVIYDSETAIENSVTHFFSKTEERKGLTVVGFLELEWWDGNYIKIKTLYVAKPYRRKGLARKMMSRLIEFAKLRDVEHVELCASADPGITQEDLEKFYESVGFAKKGDGHTMICNIA